MQRRILLLSLGGSLALAACALDTEGTGRILGGEAGNAPIGLGGSGGTAPTGGSGGAGTGPVTPICGNDIIETGETCDAGGEDVIGCSASCQIDAAVLARVDDASVVANDGTLHYYFVTTTPLAYNAAEAACREVGADLVTLSNDAEQIVVSDLGASLDTYWIGARDLMDTLGGLAWWNVEPGQSSYAPPGGVDLDGGSGEQCVAVQVAPSAETGENGWQDRACSEAHPSVCEWVVPGTLE
ncbi:MAG TPA: C-type lectin domain-containing protein [Polyangiaceae bacterium]|nr:C-type lectin domain-containing protein [Polyangiaceae bacterium]